ncbi:hypothetical protein O181_082103, partial [Austropuccinia psidii MF-1]|nr:hypothetical protein [Austropuccinia psidii MF-1]
MEATPFRSVIGSPTYLVSGSRPDLAFAVSYLARHSMALMGTHWTMLDHLVGYLLKTWGHGIVLRPRDCSLNLWSDDLERSPGQISRQSSAIDFTLHRSSKQRQSSHVSHENVTQSPNPFQHYLQCSDETPTLPPHLCPHHSLRFHTPALTIFMLTWCPPDMPLTRLAI